VNFGGAKGVNLRGNAKNLVIYTLSTAAVCCRVLSTFAHTHTHADSHLSIIFLDCQPLVYDEVISLLGLNVTNNNIIEVPAAELAFA